MLEKLFTYKSPKELSQLLGQHLSSYFENFVDNYRISFGMSFIESWMDKVDSIGAAAIILNVQKLPSNLFDSEKLEYMKEEILEKLELFIVEKQNQKSTILSNFFKSVNEVYCASANQDLFSINLMTRYP
ncbi:hypothetical protein GEMRC1_011688 [Eukaryota sp. GEM-RC1]